MLHASLQKFKSIFYSPPVRVLVVMANQEQRMPFLSQQQQHATTSSYPDDDQYLESFSGEVVSRNPLPTTEGLLRSKEIPWEIYQTARLISDKDLQLLRRYDKKDAHHKKLLLDDGGERYVWAMLSVLQNVTKEETVQYVLALLDDMITADSARAGLFLVRAPEDDVKVNSTPFAILLSLLQREDWFTQEKAAGILGLVLSMRPDKDQLDRVVAFDGSILDSHDVAAKTMFSFIDWCLSQLRRPSHPQKSVEVALHALSVILREKVVRRMVYKAGGIGALMSFLGYQLSVQTQYELLLCIWLLSLFQPGNAMLSTPALVTHLVEVIRLARKEKVIRVALLSMKSILDESGKLALEMAAVESGLPKAIENRLEQTWEDPDIVDLLVWLQDRMEAGVLAMSSIERYKKEIMQGMLVPGPMHDSEQFWLENAEKLTENNSALLKGLLKLLEPSHDSTTLSLACRGIANFVTYFPHGKGIIADLHGKSSVMRLMAHPDGAVQREALLCVQKLLLSKNTLGYMVVSQQ